MRRLFSNKFFNSTLLILFIGLAAIFALGDGVWSLGGSKALNIDGEAVRVDTDLPDQTGWTHYGGDAGGMRYSAAAQITPDNVETLDIAWTFSTGDMANRPAGLMRDTAAEGTPILAGGKLVFCTPFNEIIALDPATGEPLWRYDPKIDLDQRPANQFVCRGVASWQGEADICPSRIIMATNHGHVVAIDAETGLPCPDFGTDGQVKVDPGMALNWPGEFQFTSPPVIFDDIIVVGSSISDNGRVEAPRGAVRAYDVRSGELLWTFDPIPRRIDALEPLGWKAGMPKEGHANAWAPLSVDPDRGLIFVPTSSPSPDFYGGLRPGDNRYANSVVALEAETGAVKWAYQTVHHDIWDYDLPAQPGLYTIQKDGQPVDVVAQATKTGQIFVLDRDTGVPVIPVEERETPRGAVEGEYLSPTQPFSAISGIVPNEIEPRDGWGVTWFDKRACKKSMQAHDNKGLFTPPNTKGILLYPFNGGGANWGGTAYDPAHNLVVVNMSNMIHTIRLIPAEKIQATREVFHDSEIGPQAGAPYGVKRDVLLSPLGLPCTPPPWGIIAGVDIASGEIKWRKTLGTIEDLTGGRLKTELGTPNVGGPAVTASGLTFIGATMDNYLRALDTRTGEELWKGRLPGGGQATPMIYEWDDRQYVVIYAGGHSRFGPKVPDKLVAFALPKTSSPEP